MLDDADDLREAQRRFKNVTDQQTYDLLGALGRPFGIVPGPGGGLYGDFGLGIGPGFNLHFDREGIQPSVGGGFFGNAVVGYAPTQADLETARGRSRSFGGVRIGALDVSGEINGLGDQAASRRKARSP